MPQNYYQQEQESSKKSSWPKNAPVAQPGTILSRLAKAPVEGGLWATIDQVPALLWIELIISVNKERASVIFSVSERQDVMVVTIMEGKDKEKIFLKTANDAYMMFVQLIGTKRLEELALYHEGVKDFLDINVSQYLSQGSTGF